MVDPVSPDLMRREQVLVTAEDYSKVRAQLSTATALLRRVVHYADNPMTGVNLQDIAADARAFVEAAEGKS